MLLQRQTCPAFGTRSSARALPFTKRSYARTAGVVLARRPFAPTSTPSGSFSATRIPTVLRVASTETLPADATRTSADSTASSSQSLASPAASESGPFNWFQQWYPVASLDALDPTRPHPFTLLGQNLVLWRDGSGSWRAFKDACPHRLAPLSEGRIEKDGTLLCAYHGWRFNGTGACTALPYCSPDDPTYRSSRSCAVPYPTQELGGVLWVWGEGGPDAAAAAAAKQPPLPPQLHADGSLVPGASGNNWVHRDMPYGFPVLMENVLDPAHVPVSHHKVAGNRYQDPKPFNMEVVRPVSRDEGFLLRIPNPMRPNTTEGWVEFTPPGRVRIEYLSTNGSRSVLHLMGAPMRPGWMRFIGRQVMVDAPGSTARGGSLVGVVGDVMPKWLAHVLGGLFLNQDAVFIHYQEQEVVRQQQLQLQERKQTAGAAGNGGATQVTEKSSSNGGGDVGESEGRLPPPKYYMPGQTDRAVAAWRSWLYNFGGGDVQYAPGTGQLEYSTPNDGKRVQLFDTWNAHTRQCTICLTALARLRLARGVAVAVGAAAAAVTFAAVVAKAVAANVAAAAAAAAAGGAGGAAALPVWAAGSGGGLVPVLQAAGSVLFSWQGLAAAAVAFLSAAVVLITRKLEQMMHKYEYSHADNH